MDKAALVILDGVFFDQADCCNVFLHCHEYSPFASAAILADAGPDFIPFKSIFQPSGLLLFVGHVGFGESHYVW